MIKKINKINNRCLLRPIYVVGDIMGKNPIDISITLPENINNDKLILRDNYIYKMKQNLDENCEVILLKGVFGIGKTTLMKQFMEQNKEQSIGLFFKNNFNINDFDIIEFDLANQINIIIHSKELEDNEFNDKILRDNRRTLINFSRRKNNRYYFLIDGLEEIEDNREIIERLKEILPLRYINMRFIISSDINIEETFKEYKCSQIELPGFNYLETREYLSNIEIEDKNIKKLQEDFGGNPRKLQKIKNMIEKGIKIEEILSLKMKEWEEFYEVEWKDIKFDNEAEKKIIYLLATNSNLNTITYLSEIFSIDDFKIKNILKKFSFIHINTNQEVNFNETLFAKYIEKKLTDLKDKVTEDIIKYLTERPQQNVSLSLLPDLYSLNNNYDELVEYLNVENIMLMREKTKTSYIAEKNIDLAIKATIKKNSYEQLMKLSIQKSTLLEYQKADILYSQINALVSMGEFSKAISLTNNIIEKEKRLHLLSAISRKYFEINGYVDENLKDDIKLLYKDISKSIKGDEAIKIASDLIFTLPNLAIELIEQREDMAKEDKLDYAFAKLSLEAFENKKINESNPELDIQLDEKIQNSTIKNLTKNIKKIVENYDFQKLKKEISKLNNIAEKILFLCKWIVNNKKSKDCYNVIMYTLDLIFTCTNYTPKMNIFREITVPLLYMEKIEEIEQIIKRIDEQIRLIKEKGPTIEYVKLSINLCCGEIKFDKENAYERFLNLYGFIDDITDLSVKTNAIALLFANLRLIDKEKVLDKELNLFKELKENIYLNVQKLLKTSANHYEICKDIIRYISKDYPDFAYEMIKNINLDEYRDYSIALLLNNYFKNDIENINMKIVKKYFNRLKRKNIQDKVLFFLILRLNDEKINTLKAIEVLEDLKNEIEGIKNNLLKSQIYLYSYKIYEKLKNKIEKRDFTFNKLLECIQNIENLCERRDFSYYVVSEIANINNEHAKKVYSNIQINEEIITEKTAKNLIYSIKLAIKSYSALVSNSKDLEKEENLKKLRMFINLIPSVEQQILLWGEFATRLYSYNCKDFADKIISLNINNLLDKLEKSDEEIYYFTLIRISPCLYKNNIIMAFDRLEKMPQYYKEYALFEIVKYICTKTYYDEPYDNNYKEEYNLEYNEIKELLKIVEKISTDIIIYNVITIICNSVKAKVTSSQKKDIIYKLNCVIQNQLPDKNNIKHLGYKIIAESQVEKLNNNKIDIGKRESEVKDNVDNEADKAYILCVLADLMGSKYSIKIKELLTNAKEIIDKLPSKLDRLSHYETFASMAKGKDAVLVQKALKDAMLIATKGTGNSYIKAQRNIIDLAYKLDESLALSLLNIYDDENIRLEYRKNIEQQSRINKLKKMMMSNYNEDIKIKDFREYSNAAWKNLASLNAKRLNTFKLDELSKYLEIASNIPISMSFPIYSWIYENNIKKYIHINNAESQKKFKNMFDNALLSCELAVRLVTQSNTLIIKDFENNNKSIIIEENEENKAINYIVDWAVRNEEKKIIINDPYFSMRELYLVKEIYYLLPECEFEIVTTKEYADKYLNNCNDRQDEYINEWRNLSDQEPPECKIWMMQLENKKSPIHDRWILGEKSGLELGGSINGFGKKIMKISSIEIDDVIQNELKIREFLDRKIRVFKEQKVNISQFNL
ncbi:MAG: ATP-binding protein [Clostridium sp.]